MLCHIQIHLHTYKCTYTYTNKYVNIYQFKQFMVFYAEVGFLVILVFSSLFFKTTTHTHCYKQFQYSKNPLNIL